MENELREFRSKILQLIGEEGTQELSNEQLIEKLRQFRATRGTTRQETGTHTARDSAWIQRVPATVENPDLAALNPKLPTYTGEGEDLDPFGFLEDLAEYVAVNGVSEEVLLKILLPKVLKKTANDWFKFRQLFEGYPKFRTAFLHEYFSHNFDLELIQRIAQSFQSPSESLAFFTRRMAKEYARLQNPPPEEQQV